MKKHAVLFGALRLAQFICLVLLSAFASFAWSQLPRPLANPNLDLRAGVPGREVLALGDGSFIVSGDFAYLADVPRQQIAKVRSDGSVDSSWAVSVNGIVWEFIRDGDRLILIGQFFSVNGVARRGLAAVSILTGQLEAWDPNAGSNSSVVFRSAVKLGDSLFVGGDFTQVGSLPRTRLAKISATSGALDASWVPSANAAVVRVDTDGSSLFISGDFLQVNGTTRNRAAKLSLSTGTLDAWAPTFDGQIIDQAVDGGQFYATGCFNSVNGTTRNYVARVDTVSGLLDGTWAPQTGGCTIGIEVTSTHVYVGKPFDSRIVRFSKSGTGALDASFAPQLAGGTFGYGAREVSASNVVVWGEFKTAAGTYAPGLAVVNRSNGSLVTSLSSEQRGSVRAVLPTADGGTLLGGFFSRVRNHSPSTLREGLVKLTSSGVLDLSFTTNADGGVNALTSDSKHIYVGGDFNRLGAQALPRLARMNNSFVPDASWAPQTNSSVYSLALDPTTQTVFSGGFFFISGQVRNVAQIRLNDAGVTNWNPQPNGIVRAIAVDAGSVFLGGDFTSVSAQARARLAKVSATTGALDTAFSADANNTVNALLLGPANTLYVGGFFNTIGTLGRPGFAKLLTTSGAPDPAWNTFLSGGSVVALAPASSGLYIGGGFSAIANQARSNLARLSHTGVVEPLFAPAFDQTVLAVAEQGTRVVAGGFFNYFSQTDNFIGVQAFPLTATPVNTTTTITEDAPENSQVNQSYRVTANVSSVEGPPAQNSVIEVSDDRGSACTIFVGSSGSGSCDLNGNRDVGQRTLTASFAGTPLFLPSSDTEMHTIAGASSTPPINTAVELRSPVAPSASVRLSDGSVVIAGSFSRVGNLTRRGLAKLLPDGSVDPSFQADVVGFVGGLARDSQDNIFVSGSFGYIGSTLRRNIAKISANGAVIAAWQPGQTCINSSGRLAVDSAGDLYASCTQFASGSPSRYDTRFYKLAGSNGATLQNELFSASQPATAFPSFNLDINGDQLYVSGTFTGIAGAARVNLARLGLDGALDASFNPGAPNGFVSTLEFAPDGSLYAGGDFTLFGAQSAQYLAKLSPTGLLDPSFIANANSSVRGLLLDGSSLYAAGFFSTIGGANRGCVAKLDPATGSADVGYVTSEFSCQLLRKLGSSLLTGNFALSFQGAQRLGVVRLDSNTGNSLAVELVSRSAQVRALARQADGATLVGGYFARVGTTHQNLIRITPSGAFDTAFNPSPNSQVNDVYVGGPDSLYVAGSFGQIGGVTRFGLAKLLSSGAGDAAFNANLSGSSSKLLALTDGLLVGGGFSQASGQVRNGLAKVDFNSGGLDALWAPTPSTSASIRALEKDATGNVYAAGRFSTMGGVARQNLAKISGTGTGAPDSIWTANASSTVNALLVDGNDLFVGGFFSSLGGVNRLGLGKVSTAAPAVVASFNPANNEAFIDTYALAKSLDGNLLVGGTFTRIGGQFRSRAAKLNPMTGAVDPLWNPSFDNTVFAILPGYGSTPVVNRNPLVEQNVAFGGDFEFIGDVQMPGFTATTDAVSAPLSERVFCSGFEDAGCAPLP